MRYLQAGPYNPNSLRYEVLKSLTGVPGNRVRTLAEDATVNDMIMSLDELYGTIMTFGALFIRLCAVRQRLKEAVIDYDSRLARAFAILRHEFPDRYRQDHVEDKKGDLFFEGLLPDLRNALRYLTRDNPPATYRQLLQAARQQEQGEQESSKMQTAAQPVAKSTFRKPWVTTQAHQSSVTPEEPSEVAYESDEFDAETREAAAKIAMNAGIAAKRSFYTNRRSGDNAQKKTGCWSCGEEGHFQRECPHPKNGTEGGRKGGNPPQSKKTQSQ